MRVNIAALSGSFHIGENGFSRTSTARPAVRRSVPPGTARSTSCSVGRYAVARLGEPWISECTYPELAEVLRSCGFADVRAEPEGPMVRRLLGLPPSGEVRPSHLALGSRGWPGQVRS
jgi:hypothetical protein